MKPIYTQTRNGPTRFPDNFKRIILSAYLQIGDRVEMASTSRADNYETYLAPNGTLGTVIGFHRYRTYVTRLDGSRDRRGEYEANGCAYVLWDNGVSGSLDVHNSVLVNDDLDPIDPDRKTKSAFDTRMWIAELPELDVWEGDTVVVTAEGYGAGCLGVMERIAYHNIKEKRDDGSPMPIYDVRWVNGGGSSVFEATEVEVKERGYLWHYFNDKDNLRFKSIKEEAWFFRGLGHFKQVQCPATGNYAWTLEAAKEAVEAGTIDSISVVDYGRPIWAYKHEDEDLSRRMAQRFKDGIYGV